MSAPNNPPDLPFALLMTRPQGASVDFIASLPAPLAAQLVPVISPLLEIVPTGAPVDLATTDAVIFTSANGVRFAPEGAGRRAFCVGDATTDAAQAKGWVAEKSGDTAHALADTLCAKPPLQRLIHLSGAHVRGDIVARLNAAGADAHRVTIYDQKLCELTGAAQDVLAAAAPVIVPLFSPRTAERFFDVAHRIDHVIPVVLSDAIAGCVPPELHSTTRVAARPNARAMVDALAATVSRLASG